MICNFCYRACDIKEGGEGYCHVRKVHDNHLYSSGYGYLDALDIDPVEKKPLYHFLPGTKTLSVVEAGCNYHCDFCQNWQLSQSEKSSNSTFVTPEKLVELALQFKVPSISFTYSEPIVWQDYVINTSILAKKEGLKTIMVTNGSFSKESLKVLYPLIDAFNIDLKGDAAYYKRVCNGDIEPVLNGIEYMVEKGCHVEVTTLLIENIHTETIIKNLGKALKQRGVNVWHLTRFFPSYKMKDRAETSEKFLANMINIASASGIPYIYGGNTSSVYSTFCSNCKRELILRDRIDYSVRKESLRNLENGYCIYCNNPIYGVFD
ncbi:MAG: AmmeMemoRadiSam system radical SAM enzyme [Spirochaetaceae bacterium]|nr:AmmeMemoRadiSam system radical SAM enzyme [Spirochaetaceae bacterium]